MVMHEYKIIGSSGNQEELLEIAFWQVYANNYLEAVVGIWAHEINHNYKKVYAKALYFFKMRTNLIKHRAHFAKNFNI
jgi:hypothetical protein